MCVIWEDFLEEVGCDWYSEEGKETETVSAGRLLVCASSYFLTLSTRWEALFLKISKSSSSTL